MGLLASPHVNPGDWLEKAVDYATEHFGFLISGTSQVITSINDVTSLFYVELHPGAVAGILTLLAWRVAGWRLAAFTVLALLLIWDLELWEPTMSTLALMTTSVLLALVVGVPFGILAAESDAVDTTLEPVLDFLQTLHPFVYLVPVVVAFGIGIVPAVLATVIYVIPISIRLTNLGIRQVTREVTEAGEAFGCTRLQLLLKVKLPLGSRSVLAGVNQTVMLSLGFIVIAALIGAGGLGQEIVTGITRLDLARGFNAGIAVVIVAIILDRIGRAIGLRVFERGSPQFGQRESH